MRIRTCSEEGIIPTTLLRLVFFSIGEQSARTNSTPSGQGFYTVAQQAGMSVDERSLVSYVRATRFLVGFLQYQGQHRQPTSTMTWVKSVLML